jgi:hypothetical protein
MKGKILNDVVAKDKWKIVNGIGLNIMTFI